MTTRLIRPRRFQPNRCPRGTMFIACLALTAAAWAGDLGQVIAVNLPAQSLSAALRSLAKQADLQISFPPADVDGLQSASVTGQLTAREALAALLKATDLRVIEQSAGSVVVRRENCKEYLQFCNDRLMNGED
jgi:iron complex outermembrane receptor protein